MGNDWLLVFFTAFAVLGTGLAAAAAAGESRTCPLGVQAVAAAAALICLSAGGVLCVMHLGRPELIFGALGHPSTGIFREFVTFALTAVLIVLYLAALLRGAEARTTLALSGAAAVASLLLSASIGSAFVMPWRPAWNTWTLVLPYLGWTAVSAAFARSVLLACAGEPDDGGTVCRAGSALLLVLLTAVYIAAATFSGGWEAVGGRLLTGDLAMTFWGSVLIGMALPLGIAFVRAPRTAGIAGLAAAFAGSALFQWTVQLLGTPVWHFFRQ